MTKTELKKQYQARAQAETEAGGEISIDYDLPMVAIRRSDGEEYFYQEWQAEDLLATVPSWIDAETYLLAVSQDW